MPSFRPSQAAELLGVSVDTVRRWADEGRLKTTKAEGGHRLIDGKDLARFLTENAKPYEPDVVVQSARNRFVGRRHPDRAGQAHRDRRGAGRAAPRSSRSSPGRARTSSASRSATSPSPS